MSVFGTLFRVSTFGESHGIGVGCIVDGVPPGLHLTEADVQPQLTRRRPGQSILTTQRQEMDAVTILSGTENGVTLGTPLAMMVKNQDQRKHDYANTSEHPRPGHADYTYHVKYAGIRASSGGGRASARETIGRVAAGAVAEKWMREAYGCSVVCWVSAVGEVEIPKAEARRLEREPPSREEIDSLGALGITDDGQLVDATGQRYRLEDGSPLPADHDASSHATQIVHTRCPHPPTAARMAARINQVRLLGDSIGGVLTTVVKGVPVGIGEPCFDKLEAELAKAMLSLPATKGFEIGDGFEGSRTLLGSQHNDLFAGRCAEGGGLLYSATNHAGGTLGGISSGQDLVFRVAIKAVSSISVQQHTARLDGSIDALEVKGRHDPCVLPRAPPLLEAMAALVVADLTMRQRARAGPVPLATLPEEVRPERLEERRRQPHSHEL